MSEIWSVTLLKKHRLMLFKNVAQRKIFRPRIDEVMGQEEIS